MNIRSHRHIRRGSSMVAVFWLMSILALAVFAAVRVVSHDVDIVTSQIHGSVARQMAERGLAVAVHPRVESSDPLLRQTFEEGEGFTATISSEAVSFNINLLLTRNQDDLMIDILEHWGFPQDEQQPLMDALKDWIDADELEGAQGAEAGYYQRAGQPNFPFNRPFYDIEEMRLVRGMAMLESYAPDWRKWFTVWSGQAGININEAPAELIAVAAQAQIEDVETMLELIRGPDGIRYTEDDVPFESVNSALSDLGTAVISQEQADARFVTSDNTSRIESTGRSGSAKRKIIAVLRGRDNGRPEILQRKEIITP